MAGPPMAVVGPAPTSSVPAGVLGTVLAGSDVEALRESMGAFCLAPG